MWGEGTYLFPYFNGTTFEFWEWKNNFITRFTGYGIIYSFLHLTMSVIGALEVPILYFVRAQIRPDVGTRFGNSMGNSSHLMNM